MLPQSECSRDFGRLGIELGSSSLCAVSEVGDTCGGDSGSGLVRPVGDRSELVGIVSYGVGCDSSVNGQFNGHTLSLNTYSIIIIQVRSCLECMPGCRRLWTGSGRVSLTDSATPS